MNRLNNKGFTLIEVLAVIIILGVLASIMIPTVSTIIKNNKEKNFNNLKNSIISSAKMFISDNRYNITLDSSTCSDIIKTRNIESIKLGDISLTLENSKLTLGTLVDYEYLTTNKNNEIIDPNTDKKINLVNSYVEVTYNCDNKDYKYKLNYQE